MSGISEKKKKLRKKKTVFFKIAQFNEHYLHFSNLNLKRKLITLFSIVLLCLLIDLLTKYYMESSLIQAYTGDVPIGENQRILQYEKNGEKEFFLSTEREVIANFWSFEYIRNYNIGFSALLFLERYFSQQTLKIIFIFLQLGAVIFLLTIFFVNQCRYLLPTAFLISGGLGNSIDRMIRGYVVDFVKWYWAESPFEILNPWPIFNAADVFVSTGIALLLYSIVFSSSNFRPVQKTEKQGT